MLTFNSLLEAAPHARLHRFGRDPQPKRNPYASFPYVRRVRMCMNKEGQVLTYDIKTGSQVWVTPIYL